MRTSADHIGTTPPQSSDRLLVVEPNAADLASTTALLRQHGYDVTETPLHSEGQEHVRKGHFQAILCSLIPRVADGLPLLETIRAYDLDVPVIVLTEGPMLASAMVALEHGAMRYLIKPILAHNLIEIVGQAVLLHRMAKAKRDALNMLGAQAQTPMRDLAESGTRLDAALKTLWMAYQPIVDWRSEKAFGYEALVRCREPSLPHPPALFDAAEQLGRLLEVSRHIRAKVAEDLNTELQSLPETCSIFVNLHTRDLLDEDLYNPQAPLSAFARRVVLEITERSTLDEIHDVSGRVGRLRALGYRIAIDDLGAGYAGLSTFAQLEPEVVKLDMSLVRDVHNRSTKRKIIATIANLCRELGMQVIAEGIETPNERDIVAELGCGLLQGYLFGKPGPGFLPPSF